MLYLVATPIGDASEITLRAIETLKNVDVVLCESTKETSTLLKRLEIKGKRYEVLNEHSTPDELDAVFELCKTSSVALVSDCGTPAFCDPGNDLIKKCREAHIEIKSVLGASSLMGLLSQSSVKLDQFLFRGFLPADSEKRLGEWQKLKTEKRAVILMDTPYRLRKTMDETALHFGNRNILLVMNLSQPEEKIFEGKPAAVIPRIKIEKAEFMLLVYPES